MHYEERTRISTPEGLELELDLAGVGSRLAAWLLDTIIQGVLIVLIELLLINSLDDSAAVAVVAVVGTIAAFLVVWGYHVLFEAFRDGQTPGKKTLGLRVLDREGGPVIFSEAAVRNLIRPIDEWGTMFIGALVSIARSQRNQRIGDHAAGTIVVRDARREAAEPQRELLFSETTWRLVEQARGWDTTRLTDEDLATARQYLARRHDLPADKRHELSGRLAASLRARIAGVDEELAPERLLEALVALRSTRG